MVLNGSLKELEQKKEIAYCTAYAELAVFQASI
jgi:hypothetical protein